MKKNDLKFSNIGKEITQPQEITEIDISSAQRHHKNALEDRRLEIIHKIKKLEEKLQKHSFKENMLDKIISGTYIELENLKENEFTKRGQKQSVLIKQLEALSILHDTILKYEDMIQKYHKILIDLENNKFNSYIKIESLKKEEKETDDNLAELLVELQKQLQNEGETSSPATTGKNMLIDEIESELKEQGY